MSKDFTAFSSKIKSAVQIVQKSRTEDLFVLSLNLLATVKRRVINKGEDANGSSFSSYSNTQVGVNKFKKAESRSQSAFKVLVKKVQQSGKNTASYKEWREVNKLQTQHKDFSFTSRMWKSIFPLIERSSTDKTTIEIKAKTTQEQNKLDNNSEREKISLLAVSAQEASDLKLAYEIKLKNRLQQAGL